MGLAVLSADSCSGQRAYGSCRGLCVDMQLPPVLLLTSSHSSPSAVPCSGLCPCAPVSLCLLTAALP